jgi:hypothetical protein
MDNSRIPKKVLDGKFYGRRPVGRPRLRWEYIRRDSLLLNIREWRRWAGDRDIWRRTIQEARAQRALSHHLRRRCKINQEATQYRHSYSMVIYWSLQANKKSDSLTFRLDLIKDSQKHGFGAPHAVCGCSSLNHLLKH